MGSPWVCNGCARCLLVVGLPWVCSPFARHWFAVGLLTVGHGFDAVVRVCSPWAWVWLAMGLGLAHGGGDRGLLFVLFLFFIFSGGLWVFVGC